MVLQRKRSQGRTGHMINRVISENMYLRVMGTSSSTLFTGCILLASSLDCITTSFVLFRFI